MGSEKHELREKLNCSRQVTWSVVVYIKDVLNLLAHTLNQSLIELNIIITRWVQCSLCCTPTSDLVQHYITTQPQDEICGQWWKVNAQRIIVVT